MYVRLHSIWFVDFDFNFPSAKLIWAIVNIIFDIFRRQKKNHNSFFKNLFLNSRDNPTQFRGNTNKILTAA